jgi:hypothetical protein
LRDIVTNRVFGLRSGATSHFDVLIATILSHIRNRFRNFAHFVNSRKFQHTITTDKPQPTPQQNKSKANKREIIQRTWQSEQRLKSRMRLGVLQRLQIHMPSSVSAAQKISTGCATWASRTYRSVFEAELGDVIPVVHTSIGGTRIIGRLTAGKRPPKDPSETSGS